MVVLAQTAVHAPEQWTSFLVVYFILQQQVVDRASALLPMGNVRRGLESMMWHLLSTRMWNSWVGAELQVLRGRISGAIQIGYSLRIFLEQAAYGAKGGRQILRACGGFRQVNNALNTAGSRPGEP